MKINRELSSYAFNTYGNDAYLYNGILDLETRLGGGGNLYSTDDPPFGTLEPTPAWPAELMLIGAAIRKRHPAHCRCSSKVVTGKLTTIMRDTPESERSTLLRYIDAQHAKWCASEAWTKEGGKFAKSLEAWLNPARRLWENEPLAVESLSASKSDEFWAGV